MAKPSAVIDTNVWISALLNSKPARAIIDLLIDDKFRLFVSSKLMAELTLSLRKPRFNFAINDLDRDNLIALIMLRARFIEPTIRVNICRDKDDNMFLECALSAKADCVISGDKDLLVLNPVANLEILTPKEFLRRIIK